MRAGWKNVKLSQVCTLINGRAYKKPELLATGKYPVLRVGNLFTSNQWYYSDLELNDDKYIENGDLIYAWSASFGPRIWEGEKVIYHYHIWKVVPDLNLVTKDFLFHLFEWDKEQIKSTHGTGTTMMHVGKSSMDNRILPIPPLPEQQQIVSILDKAFTAIDQAKANIERNIENAKELFQSKLNEIFSQKGEGWKEMKFGEVFKLKSGDGLTAKKMIEGQYPVYGGNGVAGHHNQYNFEPPQVIIGRVGALCGNARLIDEQFWLTDNAFRISDGLDRFDYDFATILLNHKKLRNFARQAAQPVVSNSSLKDILLSFPISINEQIKIRTLIRSVENKLYNLEESYKNKLLTLDELKKSILQKAFAGELTANDVIIEDIPLAAEPEQPYT